MFVDNFVVVLENIFQHAEKGKRPFRAAIDGASEVWGAILLTTFSNLAVFLPVLFVAEQAGQLFRDIALAISAGLVLSLFVSLMLVPMAAARMLRAHPTAAHLPPGVDGDGQPGHNGHPLAHPAARRPGLVRRLGHGLGRVFGVILGPLDWLGRGFLELVVGINAFLFRWPVLRLGVVAGA